MYPDLGTGEDCNLEAPKSTDKQKNKNPKLKNIQLSLYKVWERGKPTKTEVPALALQPREPDPLAATKRGAALAPDPS